MYGIGVYIVDRVKLNLVLLSPLHVDKIIIVVLNCSVIKYCLITLRVYRTVLLLFTLNARG